MTNEELEKLWQDVHTPGVVAFMEKWSGKTITCLSAPENWDEMIHAFHALSSKDQMEFLVFQICGANGKNNNEGGS